MTPEEKPARTPPLMRRVRGWLFSLAALCLAGLAAITVLRIDSAAARNVLMLGVAIAGTGAMILHARRRCPGCGEPYGYRFRITKANTCLKCGAEFPPWNADTDD